MIFQRFRNKQEIRKKCQKLEHEVHFESNKEHERL